MKRIIEIDGKELTLENNALLPRRYRHTFGRDIVVDMQAMAAAYKKDHTSVNMEVLEDITWLMLKEGGEQVGENPEQWLAGIDDTFAVYTAAETVLGLWVEGRKTTSVSKKK